jgi:uncharacterized protein YbcI
MANNNPSSVSLLTTPRRGPLSLLNEERRGRTAADPDARRGNSVPSRRQRTDAEKTAVSDAPLKTRGEIEAAMCDGIRRFELDCLGRGPEDAHAHLIGDLLILRLFGVLTVAERQLVTALDLKKGRELVKQVRTQLIETSRPIIEALVEEVTGVQMISLHHDLSTTTGEECFLFTLTAAPGFREVPRKGI